MSAHSGETAANVDGLAGQIASILVREGVGTARATSLAYAVAPAVAGRLSRPESSPS